MVTTKEEEDLINEFLLRDVPLDPDQERKAMGLVGSLLVKTFTFEKQVSGNSLVDLACFTLGLMLRDGEISLKPVKRTALDIALYVRKQFTKRGEFDSAVKAAMDKFEVERTTVTNAWHRHKTNIEEADRFWESLKPGGEGC
jgi:hypothetical protein